MARLAPNRLMLVLALALLARLTVVALFPETILDRGRLEKSDIFARNFVAGNGFVIPDPMDPDRTLYAYGRPFYGFFLAALYTMAGRTTWAIGIVQAFLGTASVFLTFLVGARLFGRRAGLLSALFMAVYPYTVFHEVHVNRTVLVTFLTLVIVLTTLRLGDGLRMSTGALNGLALGALILTEGSPMIMIPLIVVWLSWQHRGRLRQLAATLGVVLLGFLLVMAPWAIRNYFIFRQVVLISTDGGVAFYKAHTESSYRVITELRVAQDVVADFQRSPDWVQRLPEVERSRWYFSEAWRFVREHPRVTLRQALFNAVQFWNIRITPVNADSFNAMIRDPFWQWFREWAYTVSYTPLLLLGAVGAVLSFRDRASEATLLFGFFAGGTLVAMLVAGVTRYRIPLDPLLAVLASSVIVQRWARLRSFTRSWTDSDLTGVE